MKWVINKDLAGGYDKFWNQNDGKVYILDNQNNLLAVDNLTGQENVVISGLVNPVDVKVYQGDFYIISTIEEPNSTTCAYDILVSKYSPTGTKLWEVFYGEHDVNDGYGDFGISQDKIYIVGSYGGPSGCSEYQYSGTERKLAVTIIDLEGNIIYMSALSLFGKARNIFENADGTIYIHGNYKDPTNGINYIAIFEKMTCVN